MRIHRADSLSAVDPSRWPELRAEADGDQGVRLRHAMYVYPILLLVLRLTTDVFEEHSVLMWSGVAIIGAALILRTSILSYHDRIYFYSPRLWRAPLAATLSLIALVCGCLCSGGRYYYRFLRLSYLL